MQVPMTSKAMNIEHRNVLILQQSIPRNPIGNSIGNPLGNSIGNLGPFWNLIQNEDFGRKRIRILKQKCYLWI